MVTVGEYRVRIPRDPSQNADYTVYVNFTLSKKEVVLLSAGAIVSGYKLEGTDEYCYKSMVAKEVYDYIKTGLSGCSSKNVSAAPFELGTVAVHTFKKMSADYQVLKYEKELAGIEVNYVKYPTKAKREEDGRPEKEAYLVLSYTKNQSFDWDLPYTKLTLEEEFGEEVKPEDRIKVRGLDEISLKKDISWLLKKNYYIINDDALAEQIFSLLENWNGPIVFDTETTGLRINMFSKINGKEAKMLEEYNSKRPPEEQIRSDKLVGIIFCVEENTSYYFPCFNRKFTNIYEDKNSEIRRKLIEKYKAEYTIGQYRNEDTDMARYWRSVKPEDVTSDILLMERVRFILTHKHIAAHNGVFDWKVAYCYDIDMNLKDDTIILHQLMYKFRSTTRNSGESSKLKDLAVLELGINQLDLEDFFVGYKEEDSSKVNTQGVKKSKKAKKKNKMYIDFSYMDYAGAKAYAPADGDVTLCLLHKYKKDLLENHKEMEYLYNVELVVACAVGYMEFYGHRIDENKIDRIRDDYIRQGLVLEHRIRQTANLSAEREEEAFKELYRIGDEIKKLETEIEHLKKQKEEQETAGNSLSESQVCLLESLEEQCKDLSEKREIQEQECRKSIDESENQFNCASPAQVAELFFDKMGIPPVDNVRTVAKKPLKSLCKMKNEDGSNKYPIVHLYSEWKNVDTLLTKFFDNLQNYMYPGGFIFSHYGQISTATGRMSCNKPKKCVGPLYGDIQVNCP